MTARPRPLSLVPSITAPAALAWINPSRLVAATVAAAVVIVALIVGSLAWRDRAQTFREAELLTQTLASVLAEHASRLFESSDFVLKEARKLAGPAGTPIPADRATHEALADLVERVPYVVSIWLGDSQGNAVVTSRAWPVPQLNAGDRDFFKVPRDQPEAFYVGLLPDNRYRDVVLINTSRRLEPIDGPFRGFVQVSIAPDYIRSLYTDLNVGYDTVFWLLDPQLRPLLREPPVPVNELVAAPTAIAFAPVAQAGKGLFQAQGPINERERLFAHHLVSGYGAHVVVGIATDDIAARWRSRLRVFAWSGLAGIFGILALGHMAWQRARHEQALMRSLDGRVRERTAELEDTLARLEASNTRLEEALTRKDVLLREVNHRVKNSLQLVASLLQLQERETGGAEMAAQLGEARRRVATIARVHERLYQTDRVESVALAGYVRELCRDLEAALAAEGGRHRLLVEAVEIDLSTDMVIPLALIINELVTNAWKHAFPVGTAETVRVSLTVVDQARLRLDVTDAGIGLPEGFDPLTSPGLGMRIVKALARQLGGTFAAERRQPGSRFIVEAPIVAAGG